MRARVVGISAFALVVLVFVVDALTPQTLVVAILLNVPIVLAALAGSRRLTVALVVAAVVADIVAAFINASHDAYRWEAVGVGDRVFTIFSILLVGFLSTEVQERAARVGRLSAQETRARREAALATVSERIRGSLSPGLVLRAIVREAAVAFEGERAVWYPARNDAEVLSAPAGSHEVDVVDERPPPEIVTLTHRVAEDRTVAVVRTIDPVGRFVLDRLKAGSAIAIPIADRGESLGVLIVAFAQEAPPEPSLPAASAFATIAVNALWQARLFGELTERNEALSERQAIIQDLVYAISHDLRTPLAALSMTLQQAVTGAHGDLPSEYVSVLRDSLASIDDLQRLAETLLIVARLEAGEPPAPLELVDLNSVAREIVSEQQALAGAKGIALRFESEATTRVRAGRGDLRRAISNLVANALAHTPSGGAVVLRLIEGPQTADIVVSDDGYGIEPAMRAKLFERFAAGSRSGEGTGLGLYIVRRIAAEIGGGVAYKPNEPRGSVFTLTVPKVPA